MSTLTHTVKFNKPVIFTDQTGVSFVNTTTAETASLVTSATVSPADVIAYDVTWVTDPVAGDVVEWRYVPGNYEDQSSLSDDFYDSFNGTPGETLISRTPDLVTGLGWQGANGAPRIDASGTLCTCVTDFVKINMAAANNITRLSFGLKKTTTTGTINRTTFNIRQQVNNNFNDALGCRITLEVDGTATMEFLNRVGNVDGSIIGAVKPNISLNDGGLYLFEIVDYIGYVDFTCLSDGTTTRIYNTDMVNGVNPTSIYAGISFANLGAQDFVDNWKVETATPMEAGTLTLVNCQDGFLGDAKTHMTAQVAALTDGFTPGINATHDYFTVNNGSTTAPNQALSANCFTAQLDISFMSSNTQKNGVDNIRNTYAAHLVSPTMCIGARHATASAIGDTVVFQKRSDQTFITRNVADIRIIAERADGDLMVMELDAAIDQADIPFLKLAPSNWRDYMNISVDPVVTSPPVIGIRDNRVSDGSRWCQSVVCSLVDGLNFPDGLVIDYDHPDYIGWQHVVAGGDSGFGVYFLIDGELVMLSCNSYESTINYDNCFDWPTFIPEINEAMQTMSGDPSLEIGVFNMNVFN